ncbi:MAG TPA: hypothetical protein VFU33_13610 [Gaiellaceae bacterium]|nr:hypothetical protein [Gaiellaceae bacterium]
MTWLSWRQQRVETLITAGLLVVLAAAFIPIGIHVADLFAQQHLARCVNSDTQACQFAAGNLTLRAGALNGFLDSGWFNLIPGLIGVALAAPLLLDRENGTTQLAWTQSITRRRWLATKGIFAVATVLVAGAAFSLLFTWYRSPFDRLYGRWDKFDFEGIVPVAYALFALGLALAVGVLVRRSTAALIVAFGVYVAARLFVESWLRQRFSTPLSATWRLNGLGPNLTHAWILREGPSDKAGHFFTGSSYAFQSCPKIGPNGDKTLGSGCAARHGAGFTHALYQPASRFWEFQGIETALFGGIALLLLAFAAWRLLASD